MSFNRRLFLTEGVCLTDSVQLFGSGGVALWTLNSNANDAGGVYNGSAANVTFGVSGHINTAARFNGSNSKITAPSIFSSSYAGSFSFSVWFNTSNTDSSLKTMFVSDETVGSISGKVLGIFVRNSKLELTGYNFPTFSVNGTTNISDGDWHNIVMVLDNPNKSLKVYLDGDSSPEITKTLSTANIVLNKVFTEPWTMGSQGPIRFFNGDLDQIRLFSRTLSFAEITTLYNEQAC